MGTLCLRNRQSIGGENSPRLKSDTISLTNCALFRGLDLAERKMLVAHARIRNFAAAEVIFLAGMAQNGLMIVISGSVRISGRSRDGKEILLAIVRPGEIFGEIGLLDGKERSADAHAMTDCSVAILARRDVMAFLDRHPQGWRGFVDVLCSRLRRTDNQLVEVALLPLPIRLAKTLLRVIGFEAGGVPPGIKQNVVRLSQRELGTIVGVSREQVNRCLQEWQSRGLVRIDYGAISILDSAGLQRLVEQV
jgi:CRP/FNR family cyclic AMP-dependent transcriptional regulator